MLAHLQGGEFRRRADPGAGHREVDAHATFGAPPELNGMALGFYEETRNGHRIIGHGGDTVYFHSDMHLVADQRLGFFMSYNSAGKGKGSGRTLLWEQFLDRYFPCDAARRPACRGRQGAGAEGRGQLPGEPPLGQQVPPAALSARADQGLSVPDGRGRDRDLGSDRLQREAEDMGTDRQRRVPRRARPGEGRLPDGSARTRGAGHRVPVLRLLPTACVPRREARSSRSRS